MNKLPYLIAEINAALEVYLSGRTGQQYNRTAFILCDDCAELASKLFLLTSKPGWRDTNTNGSFKRFKDITAEVREVLQTKQPQDCNIAKTLLTRIEERRFRRNDSFHSTHLLDLNFHAHDCVEAFCDILDYGKRLDVDLAKLQQKADLTAAMTERYPDRKPKTIQNWVSQVWPFAHEMMKGDLVVLPLKSQPAIQIAEITGDYHFEPSGPDPYFHWRPVKWIAEAVPRANFGQDLLYTFGAFMAICRVQRNNAEQRIAAMQTNGWKPETIQASTNVAVPVTDEAAEDSDLEELARDQIAQLIAARFKGHGLTRLVEAILNAQGYTTYRSPEGADGGADIIAGAGPLGFGAPRLCVEMKS